MTRSRKFLIVFIIVFGVLGSSFSLYFYQVYFTPNILIDQEEKALYIPEGANFKMVQDSLLHGNYVKDLVSFSFLARLMKYDRYIKPGRYLLKPEMSNSETVRLLRSGMQSPVKLTFNNIRLENELAGKITPNLEMTVEEFNEVLQDTTFIRELGFDQQTIKCLFIPNTYEVYWTISPKELFSRMKREYNNFWTSARLEKAKEIGLSPDEVCTLASIVQAETRMKDESPMVAGLYINRLKRGIALQADPTLVYAAGDFSITRVLNKHKEIESPYNTYKYAGLPPGPINLPSMHNLESVLNYADHNYIYMVAREDFSGYHHFSKTLQEHMNYARRYQNALNKAKVYR